MKAWIDENNVVVFRSDVPLEEAGELDEMLGTAFNRGVVSGYVQGFRRAEELLTPSE